MTEENSQQEHVGAQAQVGFEDDLWDRKGFPALLVSTLKLKTRTPGGQPRRLTLVSHRGSVLSTPCSCGGSGWAELSGLGDLG